MTEGIGAKGKRRRAAFVRGSTFVEEGYYSDEESKAWADEHGARVLEIIDLDGYDPDRDRVANRRYLKYWTKSIATGKWNRTPATGANAAVVQERGGV